MTFIIALGIIIILLCSASVFKLIQPKHDVVSDRKRRAPVKSAPKKNITKPIIESSLPEQSEPAIDQLTLNVEEHVTPKQEPFVTPMSPVDVPGLISINLCAEVDKPYMGYELLQALLSCGMRFGVMNIFHRHEKKTGLGPIYFSLASCTQEGTFDLAKIGAFSCNGLVLFMKPKEVEDPVKVFELMLDTADQLISDLGGKVLNAKQQLLKKEDVLRLHQQLQQYTKQLKTIDLS